jgi:hypothetical protein
MNLEDLFALDGDALMARYSEALPADTSGSENESQQVEENSTSEE